MAPQMSAAVILLSEILDARFANIFVVYNRTAFRAPKTVVGTVVVGVYLSVHDKLNDHRTGRETEICWGI